MLQNDYLEGKKKTNICLSVSLSVFDEIHSFIFFFITFVFYTKLWSVQKDYRLQLRMFCDSKYPVAAQ